jgi:hypothetical protein
VRVRRVAAAVTTAERIDRAAAPYWFGRRMSLAHALGAGVDPATCGWKYIDGAWWWAEENVEVLRTLL